MASATQHRPNTSTPGDGSRTITILDSNPREDSSGEDHSSGPSSVALLRLRGGPRRTRQRVAWDEDVVDNEGAGKKKSKICCIYHKPKRFDESSDEDSSDSDSDSDCGHHHMGHRSGDDGAERYRDNGGILHQLEEDSEPNAYETGPGKKDKGTAT